MKESGTTMTCLLTKKSSNIRYFQANITLLDMVTEQFIRIILILVSLFRQKEEEVLNTSR